MVKNYLRSYYWSLWNQVDELLNVEDDALLRMSKSSMHMEAHRLDLSPQNTHLIFSGPSNFPKTFQDILQTSYCHLTIFVRCNPKTMTMISPALNQDQLSPFSWCQFCLYFLGIELDISLFFPWNWTWYFPVFSLVLKLVFPCYFLGIG